MQIKVITAILTIVALANGYATYCKCQCGTDYEIFTLADDESCKQCNAEYCLGKRGTLCSGKSDEEAKKEIVTMCFERESSRDMMVVYGFVIVIATMLVFAIVMKVV